jgi:hypothetical protein
MMDQVANAIAVLGVYFALMAVLSVSVEAVVGWFKIPIPWLHGKPSPDEVLNEVRGWLPREQDAEELEARIAALNKSLTAIGETPIEFKDGIKIADVVKKVGEATTVYLRSERDRHGAIRLLAMLVGIGFAAAFQIDSLELLGPLSESARALWLETFGANGSHMVGLLLSGLAASAGSSFWHDQSARLRNLKKVTEAVRGAT